MGYSRYRCLFQVKPGGSVVANKDKEGENKAFEEIERLVNQQAGGDKGKTQKDEAKLKKEKERLAKEQAKKEAEEAKKAQKEAEKLAKEQAKKEAEEAKKAQKEAEKLAKEQAKKGKEGKETGKEAAPEVSSADFQGSFQLVLPSPAGFKQVRQFSDSLAAREDLKVVWTGGSADEGALIAISVDEPVPLARILSEMPMVEGVEVKGDKIHVILKM
jgi:septal ring factor EnvC (AmiA/AmiB activator)